MKHTGRSAFTLIELMIVVAIIAILTALAVPKLASARLTTNESNAIGTMKAIATAEAQTMAGAMIDTNADGSGEYAYFAEMAGLRPARISAGGAPAAGIVGIDELRPSAMVAGMGNVVGSVVVRSGYVFQIWLPGAAVGATVPGIAEDPAGGKAAAPFPDSNLCAAIWCAYAWPEREGSTGNNVYFMNQSGQMLQMLNKGALKYSGVGGGPAFDAAFTVPLDMSARLAINGAAANDGNAWAASTHSN